MQQHAKTCRPMGKGATSFKTRAQLAARLISSSSRFIQFLTELRPKSIWHRRATSEPQMIQEKQQLAKTEPWGYCLGESQPN